MKKSSKNGPANPKLNSDIFDMPTTSVDAFGKSAHIADEDSRRVFLGSLGALGLFAYARNSFSSPSTTGARETTSSAPSTPFVHPGLLHTQTDFDRMAAKVAANVSPWVDSWNRLITNNHASLSWTPNPQTVVYRGYDGVHPENYAALYNDVAAAYACALRWKVSGDTAYADKAVQIMNAWSSTLTALGGTTDVDLCAGIYGYEFANAGEIMRSYSGWAADDFARFQTMMLTIFYPINHDFIIRHNNTDVTHYWANWDMCNLASILAIGVLCDDEALFDEAISYFMNGLGNGGIAQAVYYLHPGYLGQWQESGRDQGHSTLGIALMGAICEMAWNQGLDLYGYDNNRFLAGAEYVAKGNLIESGTTYYTVPYVRYNNVDNVNQTVYSTAAQGNVRPCWALVYNHYVNRKGLAAPYVQMFALLVQPEGGGGNYGPNSGGYDQLGYGTLTCTRDPIAIGTPPSGLTAIVNTGQAILSWWGTAYATSYSVKRSSNPSGPFETVVSGISNLLSYADSGVSPGTYYYVVTAMTSSGETGPSNVATAITATQLHTYLAFNESNGTSAADSSGHAHTGTLVNGVDWVAGKIGNAVSFNGSDGYVSLPTDFLVDVADFTIAAWVYWNGTRIWERLFDFGANTDHYMFLTPKAGNGRLRFASSLNSGGGENTIDGDAALPSGQWVHVAVTLSGTLGTLYVNGNPVGSSTAMEFPPFQLGGTSQNFIGRSQYPNDPYFNGLVDDFRIYRSALSADQISDLMNTDIIFVNGFEG